MAITIELKGRMGCKGVAEGEALVHRKSFGFSLADESGVISLPGHELEGKSIEGKIMVLANGGGSSTEEWSLYRKQKAGEPVPKAVIYSSSFPYVCSTIGNIITDIPMVYGFGENVFEIIRSGDHVKVDADKGVIRVMKEEA